MKAWKVILATVVIFMAGVATGSLLVKRMKPEGRPAWPDQRMALLRRMERNLDLTPAQHRRIEQILKESQERTKKVWEQMAPQFREEFKQVNERIREELKPEQREKFEELLKQREHRRPEDPNRRGDWRKNEGWPGGQNRKPPANGVQPGGPQPANPPEPLRSNPEQPPN